MPTKTQINATLKSIGFDTIRVMKPNGEYKAYRNFNNKMVKGLRGGSFGPMTATNQYSIRNREAMAMVVDALIEIGCLKAESYEHLYQAMSYTDKANKYHKLMVKLIEVPAGRYEGYVNYYVTVDTGS